MSQGLSNYTIVERIFENEKTLIFRAINNENQKPIVIKTLASEYPKNSDLALYKREFKIGSSFDSSFIAKYLALEPYKNGLAIILEDFNAISLREYIKKLSSPLSIESFFKIGIQVVKTLEILDSQSVIHKDIKPHNILINPHTEETKIFDFGISIQISKENVSFQMKDSVEATIAYMSPEQTGRMNRSIDYRTDMYSLGVTFYELLIGKLPFISNDMSEMIYFHIAKNPVPPKNLRSDIPDFVSEIILKLLSKNAEERYKSYVGLRYDLERAKEIYLEGKKYSFQIAEKDIQTRFSLSPKLYGREIELQYLLDGFSKVVNGTKELYLVGGYSGIGKSVLVNELHKPITAKNGNFIAGKFDQYKINVPYSALIDAIKTLMIAYIGESTQTIKKIEKEIIDNLQENTAVITQVIPELELIIGKQPEPLELPPKESQNRFKNTLLNFLSIFANEKNPLVIFLDDLQWGDLETIHFIKDLILLSDMTHILIIGAYRSNEVDATHPFSNMLTDIKKAKVEVHSLVLKPLKKSDIANLLCDSFYKNESQVKDLSELIEKKTGGNPFFIYQFLQTLYDENLLYFDYNQQQWNWIFQKIESFQITDNVVDLMVNKIKKLDSKYLELLKIASCIGNKFSIKTLKSCTELSLQEIGSQIEIFLQEELIYTFDEKYKFITEIRESEEIVDIEFIFSHDRIQQATYSLISNEELTNYHFQIAKSYLKDSTEDFIEDTILTIVNHFNKTLVALSPEDKKLALDFNIRAGKKSKQASAYDSALHYYKNAISLLPENAIKEKNTNIINLYIEYSEIEYLLSNYEEAEELFQFILNYCEEKSERIKVLENWLRLYSKKNNLKKAVEIGLDVLKEIGISLPKNASFLTLQFLILGSLFKSLFLIRKKTNQDMVNLPEIHDPAIISGISVFSEIGPSAFVYDQNLFALMVLRVFNFCMKNGNTKDSAMAFSGFGMILMEAFKDLDGALRFSEIALEQNRKFNNSFQKGKLEYVLYLYLSGWKYNLPETINNLTSVFHTSLRVGDIFYANFSIVSAFYLKINSGQNLRRLGEESKANLLYFKKSKDDYAIQLFASSYILINALSDPEAISFDYEPFRGEEILKQCLEDKNLLGFSFITIDSIYFSFFHEKYNEVLDKAPTVLKYYKYVSLYLRSAEFLFIYGISTIKQAEQEKRKLSIFEKFRLNGIIKKLEKFSENCPENFKHLKDLMLGEWNRLKNKDSNASKYYENAIQNARKNGFWQWEAVASELAAEFYKNRFGDKVAKPFYIDALYAYERWGCEVKLQRLGKNDSATSTLKNSKTYYGTAGLRKVTQTTESGNYISGKDLGSIDLISVLKANNTISGEVQLEKLLSTFMQIVIENSGADRALLLLKTNNEFLIEAEKDVKRNISNFLHSKLIQENLIPNTIVNYVIHTHQHIVSDNAFEDIKYNKDSYIIQKRVQSILCIPISNKGQLIGLLYIENSDTPFVFTNDRIETLKILATQSAISIENARLFDNIGETNQKLEELNQTLEDKVVERTTQLEDAHKKIVKLEKQALEKQLAGGFAHEMRNALAGAKLVIGKIIPQKENEESLCSKNSTMLKEIFLKIKPLVDPKTMQDIAFLMRDINTNEETIERILGIVSSSTNRGLRVTTEILNYSEVGQVTKGEFIVNMESVIQKILNESQEEFTGYGITFQTDIEKVEILGNDDHFDSIVKNLILNSKDALTDKYTQYTKEKLIKVVCKKEDNFCRIEVTDTGMGIKKEHLHRIFDPFFSTKPSTGIGLGLGYISKLISIYNGKIEVESEPGEGTTFIVRLPLE
ncbi:MAG: AAA family ATPase [Leptospiraceae bacterium]|nr:AAA family ATPase [Leptospiraceae bacterium]